MIERIQTTKNPTFAHFFGRSFLFLAENISTDFNTVRKKKTAVKTYI